MLSNDLQGNNALHFAFRSKKPDTIDLIIRAGFGELDHRNYQGRTPKESTHNAQLTPQTKKLLEAFDPTSQRPREPHYVFIVNAKRIDVLKTQLEDSLRLETQVFKYIKEPHKKAIVLVFFKDEILNKEAARQGTMV